MAPSCLDPSPGDQFDSDSVFIIRLIYVIAIIIWIVIVIYFRFYRIDFIGQVILSIPIFVFIMSIVTAHQHTTSLANRFMNSSILYFLFLVATILMNWFKEGHRRRIYQAITISIFLVVITLIDFWVPEERLIYIIHFRTIGNTLAIVLLAYALYLRYQDNIKKLEKEKRDKKAGLN